ncbi:MAG: hypothetical protein IJV24_00005 [Prevotella sp.]|nr:hypothetical protein [Prevotella sp.]
MKRLDLISYIFLMLVIASCDDSKYLDCLAKIKVIGDSNPKYAMMMHDSIRPQINHASEYVRMKSIMLEMRLRDKAFMKATKSDSAKLISVH